ncbi:protein phosphatase inhibitor 3, putative [Plasmodium relictum]|uniref:Protein phosphatase inhibitor 3, putative n=1 Tax=Plasmodium relictum TaxID=85471 RepID=A0A1J1H2P6_PLARL|nr:protein phosphatase inhibitor 3, putative [Plasmodium relictum]CRG99179.1 protein phosphatase inhibitor 3, putative [Plasmodium relictum]
MHSSTTTTYLQEPSTKNDQNGNASTIVRILKLSPQKMVRWDENTIDNENAKKKSSKICCIYHKPREFGESSDSNSDSDSSDSEHNCDSCSKKDNQKNEAKDEKELKN